MNTDIIYAGITSEAYEQARKNPDVVRRFGWLVTTVLFSLQELHNVFVAGPRKDPHWGRTIIIVASAFRGYLLADEYFSPYVRAGYNPAFIDYVRHGLAASQHPASKRSPTGLLALGGAQT